MTKSLLAAACVIAAAALWPAASPAAIYSLPADTPFATPSCPEAGGIACNAITRTIGYQAKVGTKRGLMEVPKDGRLVSWTIKLSKPAAKEVRFFNETFGGAAKASIVALRFGNNLRARVVASSQPVDLVKFFGKTAEFPLETTIPVKKGWVIGISVPTWAPALAIGLGGDTSWRASRKSGKCADYKQQTVSPDGSVPQFYCLYQGSQITYSARVIPNP